MRARTCGAFVLGVTAGAIAVANWRPLVKKGVRAGLDLKTATGRDAFLRLAANVGISVRATTYSLDRADAALRDLAHDRLTGAAVLVPE